MDAGKVKEKHDGVQNSAQPGRLMTDEDRVLGHVRFPVYRAYAGAAGGVPVVVTLVALMALAEVARTR